MVLFFPTAKLGAAWCWSLLDYRGIKHSLQMLEHNPASGSNFGLSGFFFFVLVFLQSLPHWFHPVISAGPRTWTDQIPLWLRVSYQLRMTLAATPANSSFSAETMLLLVNTPGRTTAVWEATLWEGKEAGSSPVSFRASRQIGNCFSIRYRTKSLATLHARRCHSQPRLPNSLLTKQDLATNAKSNQATSCF